MASRPSPTARRRPVRYANQLPSQVESLIVSLKRNKPHWGARKIRELLLRRLPGDFRLPAKSTIHAVLDRHGLVKRMGKRRSRATGTPLSKALAPNELWCADFKGEFKLGNGRYCYPLTVTDQASRFLLMCEALETTREEIAVTAFERLFADRGLPQAICSDNGVQVTRRLRRAFHSLSHCQPRACALQNLPNPSFQVLPFAFEPAQQYVKLLLAQAQQLALWQTSRRICRGILLQRSRAEVAVLDMTCSISAGGDTFAYAAFALVCSAARSLSSCCLESDVLSTRGL